MRDSWPCVTINLPDETVGRTEITFYLDSDKSEGDGNLILTITSKSGAKPGNLDGEIIDSAEAYIPADKVSQFIELLRVVSEG